MDRQELEAWLRLTLTPGVGNDTARRLLAAFGLPQHVFAQSSTALRQLLTPAQASALAQPPDDLATQLQTCLDWLDAAEDGMPRRIVSLGDAAYPQALLAIEDPPCLLYLLGRLATLDDGSDTATTLTGQAQTAIESGANHWPLRAMAIVGSRNPTPQGSANARQFARTLAAQGICVVSGLALGIDAAAHRGAVAAHGGGSGAGAVGPAAVVGGGVDAPGPVTNADVARDVVEHGVVLSEVAPRTAPAPWRFPVRNRILAGLAEVVVVVESAETGGSMSTVEEAERRGRTVLAVPGPVDSPASSGTNRLIADGAGMCSGVDDVLLALGWTTKGDVVRQGGPGRTGESRRAPDGDAAAVIDLLGFSPMPIETLARESGLDLGRLSVALGELESLGWAERSGPFVERVAPAAVPGRAARPS